MNSFLRYPLILLMLIVTLSCSRSESFFYEVVEPEIVTGLSVHSSYLRNQEITFEVFDADGNNITIDSNFIVDGVSIVGNQISYSEIGTHQVYDEYSIDSAIYNIDTRTFISLIICTSSRRVAAASDDICLSNFWIWLFAVDI